MTAAGRGGGLVLPTPTPRDVPVIIGAMDERRATAFVPRPTRRLDVWVETASTAFATSLRNVLSQAAIPSVVHGARTVCVPAGGSGFERAAVLEVIGQWWLDAGTPDVRIEERDPRRASAAPPVGRAVHARILCLPAHSTPRVVELEKKR
jgi:hypothetical protein